MTDATKQVSTEGKLSRDVLVLNSAFLPIQVTSVRHALELLCQNRARVVDQSYITYTLDEWMIQTAIIHRASPLPDAVTIKTISALIMLPAVITLTEYDSIPKRVMRFRRRDIFARDQHTCQYCGHIPGVEHLTIDHVKPRARGGITTWDNCVTSCRPCNTKKADRSPEEAGMPLRNGPPRKPNAALNFNKKVESNPSWNMFV
jgi:5-methylcytosine-specific restriction endonuclease McrA